MLPRPRSPEKENHFLGATPTPQFPPPSSEKRVRIWNPKQEATTYVRSGFSSPAKVVPFLLHPSIPKLQHGFCLGEGLFGGVGNSTAMGSNWLCFLLLFWDCFVSVKRKHSGCNPLLPIRLPSFPLGSQFHKKTSFNFFSHHSGEKIFRMAIFLTCGLDFLHSHSMKPNCSPFSTDPRPPHAQQQRAAMSPDPILPILCTARKAELMQERMLKSTSFPPHAWRERERTRRCWLPVKSLGKKRIFSEKFSFFLGQKPVRRAKEEIPFLFLLLFSPIVFRENGAGGKVIQDFFLLPP